MKPTLTGPLAESRTAAAGTTPATTVVHVDLPRVITSIRERATYVRQYGGNDHWSLPIWELEALADAAEGQQQ